MSLSAIENTLPLLALAVVAGFGWGRDIVISTRRKAALNECLELLELLLRQPTMPGSIKYHASEMLGIIREAGR